MNREKIVVGGERAAAAVVLLLAGGIARVSLSEEAMVDPVGLLAPVGFVREDDTPMLDTNGQPYPPLDGPKPIEQKQVRTYPVRRTYGRAGQIGGRYRGDVGPARYR